MNSKRTVLSSSRRISLVAIFGAACAYSALFAADTPVEALKGVTVEVATPQQLEPDQQILAQKAVLAGVSMWCQAVNGGHTINITASNTDNAGHNCTSICYTRYNNGNSGYVRGSGFVPAHANHVLFASSYDANNTRVVTNPGSFSCN